MSPLERRCRLLLFGYPVGYRKARGEEIIGTLLDATPEGRAWPLPRDVLAMAIGGLRARCTLNRQRTTSANVRIAVIVGVAAYLCLDASQWLRSAYSPGKGFGAAELSESAGPVWLGPALVAAAVILTCTCRWRAVVLCAALPAAVLVLLAARGSHYLIGDPAVVLMCFAVLVVLPGRMQRPGLGWLWPLAVVALTPWLHGPGQPVLIAIGIAGLCWMIVVDAKLAIAGGAFLLAAGASSVLVLPSPAVIEIERILIVLGFVAATGALALWRLRRQSAH